MLSLLNHAADRWAVRGPSGSERPDVGTTGALQDCSDGGMGQVAEGQMGVCVSDHHVFERASVGVGARLFSKIFFWLSFSLLCPNSFPYRIFRILCGVRVTGETPL